jgi:ligand-binding sensor domain-containing protein
MRIAAFYIILFFIAGKNYAQSFPHIQFSHLSEKDGLSSNQVNAIVQDEDGFIWIGTSDGLNRFDGYKVRTFHQIPNEKNSLIFNGVFSIVCDLKKGLWVCTSEGISYYNKKTGRFYNFRHNPADSNSIANDEYASVYLANNNTTWITNLSVLYHFDSLLHYKRVQPDFKIMLDRKEIASYTNLVQDRQNQLWGIASSSLFLLDKYTLHIKQRFENFPGTIRTIYQDSHSQYWIGSFYGGLLRFNPVDKSFQPIPLINKSTVVNSITEWKDNQGYKWLVIGTDGGMILVDPVSLKSKLYKYLPGSMEQYSLSGNNISCVFVDRQNILWVATDNGVSYVRPSQQQFELWNTNTSEELNRQGVADFVYSCDENNSGLWFSTWLSQGLFLFNKSGELQSKYLKIIPILDSLKPFYIHCVGDSVLWFTTENALVQLNLKKVRLYFYKPPPNNPPIGLRTIVSLNEHKWWIRTRNNGANGLYIFDPSEKKFIHHYGCDKDRKGSAPMFIMDIFHGNKGEIFLASRNDGLFQYDSASNSFINLFQFSGEQLLSHSNDFESIAEDKNGFLWIGTFKGLFAFDPKTKKVAHDYFSNSLIGGVEISALCFDAEQNLWMNSNRGLFCLTSSGQIKQFNGTDGLPNNFAEGVLRLGRDGYMNSGFRNYLVRFKPDQLVRLPSPAAKVHFSEASVMDRPYFFQYNSSGEKEIVVQAGQNRFALDFSIMNYDNNNAKHYYYRLVGAMNNWQQNENGHLVFYNIAPGNYTLYVKGTEKQTLSPSEEDVVHITVKAFWWQTTAFWLACLVITILLAFFLIRRHIANIHKQAAFKQRLTEMEMTALRAQMNPHFIFNSLNSIENFIMQNKEREASDYLNKFARLIRIILENSSHNLITVAQDMEALQLYVDLEQFRFHNKFSYQVCMDKELMEDNYRIPPLLIQPFVENAIVHGIANSDSPNLRLAVHVRLEEDYIKYTIVDNGIGRKKAALYNMHYGSRHKSIGLHITKERIHIFNQQESSGDEVTLIDLYDEEGNAAGTRCEIKIKPV